MPWLIIPIPDWPPTEILDEPIELILRHLRGLAMLALTSSRDRDAIEGAFNLRAVGVRIPDMVWEAPLWRDLEAPQTLLEEEREAVHKVLQTSEVVLLAVPLEQRFDCLPRRRGPPQDEISFPHAIGGWELTDSQEVCRGLASCGWGKRRKPRAMRFSMGSPCFTVASGGGCD